MGKNKKLPIFKNNSQFIENNILNDETFLYYERCFLKLCLSMFEWINLPKGMNARFLEEVLYYNGMASLLKSETLGYINTACCFSGNLNIYGLPSKLNCYSYGFSEIRNLYTGLSNHDEQKNDCILVFNAQDKENTYSTMQLFAYRMYKADRVCDINVNAMKTPILLSANEKTKLSMINAYAQYDGNAPVIVGKKDQFSSEDIQAINTKADFVADKIAEYKIGIWNEALTFLGINNLNEKKERLVSEEVNQNNEVVNLNLQSFLIPRKEACKEFNELFGLEGDKAISVRVRSDLTNIIKKMESVVTDYMPEMTEEKEGDEV